MMLMISEYTRPLDEVQTLRAEHLTFLDSLAERDLVVDAGMKTPPTGGVVLLAVDNPDEGLRIMADDPYAKAGFSVYQAVGWKPVRGVLAQWSAS